MNSEQWDSSGGRVLEKVDTDFWKMIVVHDRWQCSSFVLLLQGRFLAGGGKGFEVVHGLKG